MDKKAITLQQLEEALRDLTRWIKDKLTGYIAEPSVDGESGYVLTSNGAGGRSWEYIPGLGELPDKTLTLEGVAADAAAAGAAIGTVREAAESAKAAADQAQSAAEHAQETAEAITPDSIGAEKKRLQFMAVPVAATSFTADGGYEDFPYRAAVALEGVTAEMLPELAFGPEDAVSGNFAPVAESYDGGVYIYAAEIPAGETVIPVITLWR